MKGKKRPLLKSKHYTVLERKNRRKTCLQVGACRAAFVSLPKLPNLMSRLSRKQSTDISVNTRCRACSVQTRNPMRAGGEWEREREKEAHIQWNNLHFSALCHYTTHCITVLCKLSWKCQWKYYSASGPILYVAAHSNINLTDWLVVLDSAISPIILFQYFNP